MAARGLLRVRLIGASFDDDAQSFIDGPLNSYVTIWVLEKVRWRRRRTQPCGFGRGDDPLRPQWNEQERAPGL